MTAQNMQLQAKAAPSQILSFTPARTGLLRRKCACGGTPGLDGECAECRSKRLALQRRSTNQPGLSTIPSIVHEVLRSSGQPLNSGIRAFMEPRFGHDFSQVRVHTDAQAEESARAVNALAYTVGRDVVFGAGQYVPQMSEGRRLLAHELTHVVQQVGRFSGFDQHQRYFSFGHIHIDDSYEQEAERMAVQVSGADLVQPLSIQVRQRSHVPLLSRANVAATTAVLGRGTAVGSGIQFYPMQVSSTRVGPVSGKGGLVEEDSSNRLSVIIGQGMTLRALARLLLPLWQTATPFTPPGATAPLAKASLSETILARGLLVYNQYYLPVPAMTRWKAGLRFPLPIDIDPTTNEGILHPGLIGSLANLFDTTWEPLLDQTARMPAVPTPTDLRQAVATFLANNPTALVRGIGLSTRAITNALEERPFILEAFDQLGANAFDVVLAFMDASINRQVALLASQRAGADILNRIRAVLVTPPATLSHQQRASLDRANLMLGQVAAIVPREIPTLGVHMFSENVIPFITRFEGFFPHLYNDPNGHCTIGYGHLVHEGGCNGRESAEFRAGITQARAHDLLRGELNATVAVINRLVRVPLNQYQFDALVSFTFNVGQGAFAGSALLRNLNAGHYDRVPDEMNRWINGGHPLPGLVTRRGAEGALFRDGQY